MDDHYEVDPHHDKDDPHLDGMRESPLHQSVPHAKFSSDAWMDGRPQAVSDHIKDDHHDARKESPAACQAQGTRSTACTTPHSTTPP